MQPLAANPRSANLRNAIDALIGASPQKIAADVGTVQRAGLVCARFVPSVSTLPRDAAEAAKRLAGSGMVILTADGTPVGRWERQ